MNYGCSTTIPRPNGKVRNDTMSSRPKKARMSRSRVKTTIIVFFSDSRGIVHKEFVPPGQTVNHAFYKDVLERLRKRVIFPRAIL